MPSHRVARTAVALSATLQASPAGAGTICSAMNLHMQQKAGRAHSEEEAQDGQAQLHQREHVQAL